MQLDEIPHWSLARLVIFWGGALPQTMTGVPTSQELAESMAAALHVDAPEKAGLAMVAQRSLRGENRWEMVAHLNQMLGSASKTPQRIHQLIASLPARAFITTTYDDLLRRAFEVAHKPLNHLMRSDQLPLRNLIASDLFQIFGQPNQPNTLVASEDDYARLWQNPDKAGLLDRIRLVFQDSLVLLIGYDLRDPDFGLLWRELLMKLGQPANGLYAFAPNLPETDRRMWDSRALKVVDAEPIAALELLVQRLSGGNSVPAMQPVTFFQDPTSSVGLTKAKLLDAMIRGFSRSELSELCATIESELGPGQPLTLELLGGDTLGDVILRLIEFMDRRNKRDVLEKTIRQVRPGLLEPT